MTVLRTDRRRSAGRGGAPPPPPTTTARVIAFPRGSWRILRRYWMLAASVFAAFAIVFVVVSALGVPVFEDPSTGIAAAGGLSALLVFGLLAGDVLLPVPASLVMVASGALFGPVAGTLLSLAGGVAGTAVAFAIGRSGSPLLERIVGPAERAAADRLLARHGALAMLITRPVPLLAETTALLAGASPLPWPRAMMAAALGMLPAAAAYALAGTLAVGFPAVAAIFVGVIAFGAGFWFAEGKLSSKPR